MKKLLLITLIILSYVAGYGQSAPVAPKQQNQNTIYLEPSTNRRWGWNGSQWYMIPDSTYIKHFVTSSGGDSIAFTGKFKNIGTPTKAVIDLNADTFKTTRAYPVVIDSVKGTLRRDTAKVVNDQNVIHKTFNETKNGNLTVNGITRVTQAPIVATDVVRLQDIILPDGILSGLGLSISGANVIVQSGTWRISNIAYSKGTTTTLAYSVQDATLSRYDILYATNINTIGIVHGTLAATPVYPDVPAGSILIGAVLITPTSVTTVPSPIAGFVDLTSNQSINGQKTFLQNIFAPGVYATSVQVNNPSGNGMILEAGTTAGFYAPDGMSGTILKQNNDLSFSIITNGLSINTRFLGDNIYDSSNVNYLKQSQLLAGTGITLTPSGNNVTISASGGATGTVTSVATGNGLTGGTITTSGTLKADTSILQTVLNFFPKGDTRYLKSSTAGTTYVPYTGATTDLNLGTHGIVAGNTSNAFVSSTYNYQLKGIGQFISTETQDSNSRPVELAMSFTAAPASPVSAFTDFHGIDLNSYGTTNINSKTRLYPFESTARFIMTGATDSIAKMVGGYFHINSTSPGVVIASNNIRMLTQSSGGGKITEARGLNIETPDLTNSSTIGSYYGVYVDAAAAGVTDYKAYYSNVASGSNRWNFFANGTANNAFAGNTSFGKTTAPTVALDVSGSALISGTLGVTGTVTMPTPFTLGATSVTSTGTQLNYLNAATGTTGSGSVVFSAAPSFTGSTSIASLTVTASGGFGTAASGSAFIRTAAGSSVIASARFLPGVIVTTPISGNFENDGTNLYYTNNTPTRSAIVTANGTANQIAGMNSAATGYEYKTISGSAGTGQTVTHGAGTITLSNDTTVLMPKANTKTLAQLQTAFDLKGSLAGTNNWTPTTTGTTIGETFTTTNTATGNSQVLKAVNINATLNDGGFTSVIHDPFSINFGTSQFHITDVSGGGSINIHFGNAAPSATNFAFRGDLASTYLNAPTTSLFMRVANTTIGTWGGTGLTMALGTRFFVTEGTNGSVGQTTLVAGTKAITITGLTTSSRAFVSLVSQGGTVTTTSKYEAKCTANTLTINAVDNTGTDVLNTLDTSIINYQIIN